MRLLPLLVRKVTGLRLLLVVSERLYVLVSYKRRVII